MRAHAHLLPCMARRAFGRTRCYCSIALRLLPTDWEALGHCLRPRRKSGLAGAGLAQLPQFWHIRSRKSLYIPKTIEKVFTTSRYPPPRGSVTHNARNRNQRATGVVLQETFISEGFGKLGTVTYFWFGDQQHCLGKRLHFGLPSCSRSKNR